MKKNVWLVKREFLRNRKTLAQKKVSAPRDATMATEAAQPAADKAEEDYENTCSPQSYVSPVSDDHKEGKEAGKTSPEQPTRGTINMSRQNSSDSEIPVAPPVHQFFAPSQNIYDSDGSDGRCV